MDCTRGRKVGVYCPSSFSPSFPYHPDKVIAPAQTAGPRLAYLTSSEGFDRGLVPVQKGLGACAPMPIFIWFIV